MDQAHAGAVALLLLVACGDATSTDGLMAMGADAGAMDAAIQIKAFPKVYVSEVISFDPGAEAGYGQENLPDVVYGPPLGDGLNGGPYHVVSLGIGGSIVVGFAGREVFDGPGPDFVVFENPFYVANDPTDPFKELGQVSVSTDAVTWHDFACDEQGDGAGRWEGCAGWNPVKPFDAELLDPLDPQQTGGDPFDLADIGVGSIRYVRITDLGGFPGAPSAGFDLDAIGAVYLRD